MGRGDNLTSITQWDQCLLSSSAMPSSIKVLFALPFPTLLEAQLISVIKSICYCDSENLVLPLKNQEPL